MNTSFEKYKHGKSEWLTPLNLITLLGEFDLDPCAPVDRPWPTAKKHFTILDDGLKQNWEGRIWLNPPYGTETNKWLKRLVYHKNGIALTFARTETKMFFDNVWGKADAIFFIKGRIRFYHIDGRQGGQSGAPSVLIAYGSNNVMTLENLNNKIEGYYINLQVTKK